MVIRIILTMVLALAMGVVSAEEQNVFAVAAEWCKAHPGGTYVIKPGVYTVGDARSREIAAAIMSGEWGMGVEHRMFTPSFKYTSALDLTGCTNVTIVATGVKMMIDGFMEAVTIRDAEGVTVKGLEIDHVRKPYTHGRVIAADAEQGTIDIRYDRELSPKAAQCRAWFADETRGGVLPGEMFCQPPVCAVAPNVLRYRYPAYVLNAEVYMSHSLHSRPAVLISHSARVKLEGVAIRSMWGMGVVGFKSKDIHLDRCEVSPSPGEGQSTNTDATHFACCSGSLIIENSRFMGHGDDATNVHNYYYCVEEVRGNACKTHVYVGEKTHSCEPDVPFAGQRLGLRDRNTLEPLGDCRVVSCVDGWLTIDRDFPVGRELLLANLEEIPSFIFRHNHVSRHLARGVLVKSKLATIEDNVFEGIGGTAIHIAAEANWGEGVASEYVKIFRNVFRDCGRTPRGRIDGAAAIGVNIVTPRPTEASLHGTIELKENRFLAAPNAERQMSIRNVKRLLAD